MSFASLLKWEDRQRLRAIVRRVHLRFLPESLLTDYECDKLIDSFSEQVIEANLRAGREVRLVS
jgi:hypothetical protein